MLTQTVRKLVTYSIFLLLMVGCKQSADDSSTLETAPPKELVIYCENGMMSLVSSLKEDFEKEHECIIHIQNDCAQNLMSLINYTGKGDIYVPASTQSFENFYKNTGQEIIDSLFIGYNNLVFMVKKGNPKNFDGKIKSLLNHDKFALIISNPETSSLGDETRRLLNEHQLYKRILPNIVALTSDSKGLVKAIKTNQADVVIDWESNLLYNSNINYVDVIQMQTNHSVSIPIYATSLSCSSEPDLTNEFLKFSKQQLDESLLSKYGFSKRETIIF